MRQPLVSMTRGRPLLRVTKLASAKIAIDDVPPLERRRSCGSCRHAPARVRIRALRGEAAEQTSRGHRHRACSQKWPFRGTENAVLQARMIKVGDLSNDELLARLRSHVGRGNVWLAGLLAYLGEVDARRLYAEQACTSTWDFCVRRLGMSESEAQRRIAAARVLRAFPLARTYLERGQLHLCAIYELYKYITKDNHEELLQEAAGKTTKEVSQMIAARFPKPDVHPCIEPLGPQPALPLATTEQVSPEGACSAASPAPSELRPRVEPLSATRYRVELTVSRETTEKLERVRDLMRHRNPNGDLEKIFDLSIDLLLTKLEKERLGKTSRPKATKRAVSSDVDGTKSARRGDATSAHRDDANRSERGDATNAHRDEATSSKRGDATNAHRDEATGSPPGDRRTARSSHIPRAVRREVFARDGEQCTYVDAEGNRCTARGFLELDHIKAKALGGSDDVANLRPRCKVHNRVHAEQVFGREYVEQRVHLRQRKYAAAHAPVFETAARGLRSLGFREPEVRDVIARLATTLDTGAPVEAVIREALKLLT